MFMTSRSVCRRADASGAAPGIGGAHTAETLMPMTHGPLPPFNPVVGPKPYGVPTRQLGQGECSVIRTSALIACAFVMLLPFAMSSGQGVRNSGGDLTVDTKTKLTLINTDARWADYRGRRALHLGPLPGHENGHNEEMVAVLDESDPDYAWRRLRSESPGVYESYVGLEPGAWTHLKIDVSGTTARLYVNRATQAGLIVTDLKHGISRGKIALWTHVSSDAYFASVSVRATS
jgi:hypothetical protein